MSGLDLVKLARELKPDLQIAIFSGFGEFTYAQEAIKYGVTDYILKPVRPQEFRQTLERMLENCRLKEVQEEQKRVIQVSYISIFAEIFIHREKRVSGEAVCE